MKVKADFPHRVREIENTWIHLADGTRLAACIWLPDDAETRPVPAILEYLPYRKNDGTLYRDARQHPYLAGHGYAAVRVDMRGSGDSDGILYDEYLPQEQADALEVLAWLAAQPWCTGDVGMMGISWGGFNSLACSPPNRYVYANGWIIVGLQKLGLYGPAGRGLAFVSRFQSKELDSIVSGVALVVAGPRIARITEPGSLETGVTRFLLASRHKQDNEGNYNKNTYNPYEHHFPPEDIAKLCAGF